ncbi:hypothetical protein [Corynebacterium ureicelerivorans]|uniref:hypothetical protein n=1 Tax=Corynebacterium ureicelerivorans TaxID=401472 RepID=UPI0023579E7F|nr:hypothetical protein [Corynebacterium ureicelerivorans]
MKHKQLVGLLTVVSLSAAVWAVEPTSSAAESSNPARSGVNLSSAKSPAPSSYRYNDSDVLKLLLFAQGPIADEHPEVATKLLQGRPKPDMPSDEVIEDVVRQLKTVDPDYHAVVTEGVQKNDPIAAEAGMIRLSEDLGKIYALESSPYQERGVTTWAWHDAHVAAEADFIAAIEVAAFEAAAVAHVAAWAVAVVPVAITYQFEMNKSSSVDRQAMVSAVTQAAAGK